MKSLGQIEKNINLDKALEENLSSDFNALMRTAIDNSDPENISIDKFFSFLNSDKEAYKGLSMDKDTANRMRSHLVNMKHGTHAAVPLICRGSTCPIISQCWFVKRNEDGSINQELSDFPLLRQCPVEKSIIEIKIRQYIGEFLGNQETLTPTSMALITTLAEIDIYDIRCDMILSQGDRNGDGTDLLIQAVDSVNQNSGEVYFTLKEHPILGVKERLAKRRDSILKQLLATPEAKANKKKNESLISNDLSQRLTQLSHLIKSMEANGVSINPDSSSNDFIKHNPNSEGDF